MALRGTAARRYAQAAFDLAKSSNSLDKWLDDLKLLSQLFGDEAVISQLEDPRVTEEGQKRFIQSLVKPGQVSEQALNLVYILAERQRIAYLPRIFEAFVELYNREKGIVVADVVSAVPLDDAHRQRVADELSKITGKTVQINLRHDPGILGGIVAQIGDELIDASVATRLAELAQRLA